MKHQNALRGRTILITGGGSGIGEALARNLAAENTVIICGRREERLQQVANSLAGVRTFVADLSNPASIDRLFAEIADAGITLDVLINNAGVVEQWDVLHSSLSSSQIFEKISTNLSAGIAASQCFIRQADRAKDNLIVNVTSEIALFPIPILPLYASSKAGMRVFTQSLRQQLRGTKFRVVEILPPAVDTDMPKKLGNKGKTITPDAFAVRMIQQIDRGREEFAPGGNVPLLKLFGKFMPRLGLRLIDKMSRKQLGTG